MRSIAKREIEAAVTEAVIDVQYVTYGAKNRKFIRTCGELRLKDGRQLQFTDSDVRPDRIYHKTIEILQAADPEPVTNPELARRAETSPTIISRQIEKGKALGEIAKHPSRRGFILAFRTAGS